MFIITTYTSEVAQSCLTLCDPMHCSARLLHPWDSPGKNTGVCCHFLLQEISLTQGSNPSPPHCRQTLYRVSHHGSCQFIQWTWKIGIIISIIILQRRIQRLRKVKWLMTYLNPQSSQIGRFQSYLCTSEAYAKHDMRQSL